MDENKYSFNIVSINVRGMKERTESRKIFRQIKKTTKWISALYKKDTALQIKNCLEK